MVILFDRFNPPPSIYHYIFVTDQQIIVAKELIQYLAQNEGEITKTEMSFFATKLHDGEYSTIMRDGPYKGKKVKLSYNKRQFYDRILTPMKSMGLIRYDLYKKTYHLSGDFSKELMKIGVMWKDRLQKEGFVLD